MTGIIILDGPDCSGKSTLQQHLVNNYKAVPMHLTYNKEVGPRMFDYQSNEMLKAVNMSQDHLVVVDRHWMSELVYANALRGGSPWPHMGRMMDRVWRKHAAIYVICLPSTLERAVGYYQHNIDNTHPYTVEQYERLYVSYEELLEKMIQREDVGRYAFDIILDEMDKYCDTLLYQLQRRKLQQYVHALDPRDQNILGHLKEAKFLFIGDQVNKKDNNYAWPFYEYRNCSLFLTEQLVALGVKETSLMWTNVYDESGNESYYHIHNLVKNHGLIPVVFGRRAEEVIKKVTRNYFHVDHPQFAKRFGKSEEFQEQMLPILD